MTTTSKPAQPCDAELWVMAGKYPSIPAQQFIDVARDVLNKFGACQAVESGSVPAALREIASWMDSGGPTFHEAELIGMNIAGPTGCGAHKECTKAAQLAFLEAARIWERLRPAAPVAAQAQQYISGGNLADRLDALADTALPGSQMQSDLYAAATIWRKHLKRPAAQQPVIGADGADERAAFDQWFRRHSELPPDVDIMQYDETFLAHAAWKARAALAQQDDDKVDAERYRWLRRGQKWSVIDGFGDTLRAEVLDAAIDAARKEQA